jgi:ParB family chromosome partitioning protein
VSRKEIERPGEGIFVEYELVAGERRLRAAKIAGVSQVPVVIRSAEDTDKMKLELAIIENLQREDLNAVDRAKAFQRLAIEFGMTHLQIAQKVGRSREYVSNTLRILVLPEDMQQALVAGSISEGHTRPLLMLADRKEEQETLFKEIVDRKMTVRESERVARRIAVEKTRKNDLTPELLSLERELTERLGTRVRIEKKESGGKVLIDFFSPEDLDNLRVMLTSVQEQVPERLDESADSVAGKPAEAPVAAYHEATTFVAGDEVKEEPIAAALDRQEEEIPEAPPASSGESEDDLYSVRNFSV